MCRVESFIQYWYDDWKSFAFFQHDIILYIKDFILRVGGSVLNIAPILFVKQSLIAILNL